MKLLAALCVFLSASAALGAQGRRTGKEPGAFTKDRLAVIVATMHNIRRVDVELAPSHRADLKPLATLAGAFDVSLHPQVAAGFYTGAASSLPQGPPAEGATVILVIDPGSPGEGGRHDSVFILSDVCTFMPNRSGVVVIDGLEDRRVTDTLRNIQAARAGRDPERDGRGGTQPATRPPNR